MLQETKKKLESLYQALNTLHHTNTLLEKNIHYSENSLDNLKSLKRTWLELSLVLNQCSPLLPNFFVSQAHLLQHQAFQNIPIFTNSQNHTSLTPLLSNRALESKLRSLLVGVLLHFSGRAINSEQDITNASEALLSSLNQNHPSSFSPSSPILPFFKDALEYLQLILTLIEKNDALLEFSEAYVDYYQTLIQVSLLKLQVLFESELTQVFHSDVLKLCKAIETKLENRQKNMEEKLFQSKKKLNSYALGPDFQRQVKELIQVRKEIESSRSETMWF